MLYIQSKLKNELYFEKGVPSFEPHIYDNTEGTTTKCSLHKYAKLFC